MRDIKQTASVEPPNYIFQPIDSCGPGGNSQGEKIRLLTNTGEVLRDLGVNTKLANDVADKTAHLQPLLSLVYRRKPTIGDKISREGRGVYHDRIPVAGHEVIVYVKGIGNESLVEEVGNGNPFPGFPRDTERLVFDSILSFSRHPRILGTETLPWGFLEYINSCVVFATEAREQGWERIEDALVAGVTVPIGMMHFKELSQHMLTLLQRRIKETPYGVEARQLEWRGNTIGLGSVGQIVPSDKRLPRAPAEEMPDAKTRVNTINEFIDTEIYRTAGKTLRRLLKMGIAYSRESSHGQNLYDLGSLAQADNSDLVFLGDYIDCDVADMFDGPTALSGTEQREAIIYRMLDRHDGLTPLAYPIPSLGISWESIQEGQLKFWHEFLEGIVPENVISQIPPLVSILRKQVCLAVAVLSVRHLQCADWEALSSERKRILKKYDRVGACAELLGKIGSNLPSYSTLGYRKLVDPSNTLGVQSMLAFLETGDKEHLEGNPQIGPYLRLSELIFSVTDPQVKGELLYQMGVIQLGREYDCIVRGPNIDVIDVFNNQHIELFRKLIAAGQYERAVKAMEIIKAANNWRMGPTHPQSQAEYLMHYYPASLLAEDANIDELYEQVRFFELLLSFVGRATPGIFSAVLMSETKAPIDVEAYAKKHGLSDPETILLAIIGSAVSNLEKRQSLYNYMESYEAALRELIVAQSDDEELARRGALSALSRSKIGAQYPELLFVHNCTMANYYSGCDQALAKEYYLKGLEYYRHEYERRKQELGIAHDLWYTDEVRARSIRAEASRRLAEKYSVLGLPKITSEYSR